MTESRYVAARSWGQGEGLDCRGQGGAVLFPDCSDGYTVAYILQNSLNCTFKIDDSYCI